MIDERAIMDPKISLLSSDQQPLERFNEPRQTARTTKNEVRSRNRCQRGTRNDVIAGPLIVPRMPLVHRSAFQTDKTTPYIYNLEIISRRRRVHTVAQ